MTQTNEKRIVAVIVPPDRWGIINRGESLSERSSRRAASHSHSRLWPDSGKTHSRRNERRKPRLANRSVNGITQRSSDINSHSKGFKLDELGCGAGEGAGWV